MWLARVHFHDWMWDGGPLPSLPRYLARRLPLYFSDPYWESPEKLRAKFPDLDWKIANAEVGINLTSNTSTTRIVRCTTRERD